MRPFPSRPTMPPLNPHRNREPMTLEEAVNDPKLAALASKAMGTAEALKAALVKAAGAYFPLPEIIAFRNAVRDLRAAGGDIDFDTARRA